MNQLKDFEPRWKRLVLTLVAVVSMGSAVASAQPMVPTDPDILCTQLEVVEGLVMFEGDIVLGSCARESDGSWRFEAKGLFAEMVVGSVTRAAVVPANWYWPGGTVPFVINDALSQANAPDVFFDIMDAVRHWRGRSTVRLVPRTVETDYIEFVSLASCSSSLGKVGGRQTINLYPNGACGFGSTVHEIGHALGYYHEQSRADRDTYVTIVPEKIEPGKEHNFNKYIVGLDLNAYDYGSSMHYPATAFSIDGSPTIVPDAANLAAWQAVYGNIDIGQRQGLSVLDRLAADQMYNVCWDGPGAGGYHWVTNEWRGCTAQCGSSGRSREVFCQDLNGNCVADGFCTAGSKPAATESCTNMLSCTFDTDNCGWDPVDGGDQFEWTAGSGPTPSTGTGPSMDHTSGTGFYLFTEVSSPRVAGDTAYLTSVPVDVPAGATLSFWYHYFGTDLPTMEVLLVSCAGGEQVVHEINPVNTTSMDSWRQATVTLPAATDSQIRFKVTRAGGFAGDLALDDVVYTAGVGGGIFSDGFETGNTSAWTQAQMR